MKTTKEIFEEGFLCFLVIISVLVGIIPFALFAYFLNILWLLGVIICLPITVMLFTYVENKYISMEIEIKKRKYR